jgi:ATP-binding cassette, subfamily B, bacterial PglK
MIRDTFKKLWFHTPKRRKIQFSIVSILMIISSLFEVISIGAVLPFLAVLTNPEYAFNHDLMQPIIRILHITKPAQLMLPVTIVFISVALITGTIRLLLLYITTRLSAMTGADFSINIYRRTLYQEYPVHVMRNSSEVINGVINKTNTVVGGIIGSVLALTNSLFLLISIMSVLLIINTKIAVAVLFSIGSIYWVVMIYTRQKLKENGKCIAKQSTVMIKSLQEGLGGIRDVLIDGTQNFFCSIYRSADLSLRYASIKNIVIKESPRFVMEATSIIFIAVLAYIMTQQEGGVNIIIPVLGALALGAQKLLPAIQGFYGAYSTMMASKASLEDVLELLDQNLPSHANQSPPIPIKFEQVIQLKNISFRYAEHLPLVLENINLILPKGSRIGFKGTTGSGKSTLLDIVMGLLQATNGELLIDGQPIGMDNKRQWQVHVAHVPQNIYLSDSSIEENIAFGIQKDQIDPQRVKKAAKQAQISELIESWGGDYQTFVGERGIRLSGGQRQRIGIARALYKQADVLVFDEATSALDNKTESSVMEAIKNLDKDLTIFIIAHRLSTLKICDHVIDLSNKIDIMNNVKTAT